MISPSLAALPWGRRGAGRIARSAGVALRVMTCAIVDEQADDDEPEGEQQREREHGDDLRCRIDTGDQARCERQDGDRSAGEPPATSPPQLRT